MYLLRCVSVCLPQPRCHRHRKLEGVENFVLEVENELKLNLAENLVMSEKYNNGRTGKKKKHLRKEK